MRFAAIDVGSNAIRLLLARAFPNCKLTFVEKESLVRILLRLGDDAFTQGRISDEKAEKLVSLLKAFRHLLEVYDRIAYRACATAAMREADNGKSISEFAGENTGVNLEIIDGKREAQLICSNHFEERLDRNK